MRLLNFQVIRKLAVNTNHVSFYTIIDDLICVTWKQGIQSWPKFRSESCRYEKLPEVVSLWYMWNYGIKIIKWCQIPYTISLRLHTWKHIYIYIENRRKYWNPSSDTHNLQYLEVIGCSDTGYGNDLGSRRSMIGYILIKLNLWPVSDNKLLLWTEQKAIILKYWWIQPKVHVYLITQSKYYKCN